MTTINAMRIFVPATIAFICGVGMTPILTYFLYKYRLWKPSMHKTALDGKPAAYFNELHKKDLGTPVFGGIVVWGSTILAAGILQMFTNMYPDYSNLTFISRNQTWVPFAALIAGALVGFFDDLFEVKEGKGLRLRNRLILVGVTALLCGWWFYSKLGVSAISLPHGTWELGLLFVPVFVGVALFLYAGGVIDGVDGLAGGIFAIIFSAYGALAFFQNQLDIAGLCSAIAGGLLAFLWFNIPPARFYLSETGTMGLTLALVVVAFLTDVRGGGRGVLVLPIIALPLVITVLSNVIQIGSKKLFGRKVFRVAPLHHHFEAIGWPPYKVTMRYWIVGLVAAIVGIVVAFL
jgi:phospho-N-acetylmuramoyl-pentapeptide-transferase